MTTECPHPDFRADMTVNRLEDVGAFVADVRVSCATCGLPFAFIGVPAGLTCDQPRASVDGLELHAPIRPQGSTIIPRYPGFSVRRTS